MADKAHKATDDILRKMELRLSSIYSTAADQISKAWKAYMIASGEKISGLQEDYHDAIKTGDSKVIRKAMKKLQNEMRMQTISNRHFRNLSKQMAENMLNVNQTAIDYINGKLPQIYCLNYNNLESTVDGVGGYSFELVSPDVIKDLSTQERNLLPYKTIDGRKEIRWNIQNINSEVLQGILQGESMDKIADRFENVLGMNENSAIRNARTTVTSAENKGRQDSFDRAKKDGIVMKKQWIATPGSRTRQWHSDLDGKMVDVDDSWENLIHLSKYKRMLDHIRYPGDPEAHPANVYNCRCTMIAKVVGFKKVK